MKYQVTQAQLRAWQHPLVQVVAGAAAEKSDKDFKQVLKDAILGNWQDSDGNKYDHFWVAWNGFMPLPFTEDSAAGKRLTTLWEEVKFEQPNCAQTQEFKWRFWRPERDAEDAAFLVEVTGREPAYYELAA